MSGPLRNDVSITAVAITAGCLTLMLADLAAAGPADVVAASARCSNEAICQFSVTVRHDDEGWQHYCDRWQILAPDGEILATRILRHPHVGEQPFTRSLANVQVPEWLETVRVRAGDSKHGFGGAEIAVSLRSGRPAGARASGAAP